MTVPDSMWIRMNSGEVVERPYREAVRLLSRRMADAAEAPADAGVVPLDPEPAAADRDLSPYADAYTKDELVDLAKTNDLSTAGNKADLVERLLAADVELSAAPVAGATPENVPGENEPSPDERS